MEAGFIFWFGFSLGAVFSLVVHAVLSYLKAEFLIKRYDDAEAQNEVAEEGESLSSDRRSPRRDEVQEAIQETCEVRQGGPFP